MIKISDFGCAVDLNIVDEETVFRQDTNMPIKLPLQWLAPESLLEGVYSEKSDVVSALCHMHQTKQCNIVLSLYLHTSVRSPHLSYKSKNLYVGPLLYLKAFGTYVHVVSFTLSVVVRCDVLGGVQRREGAAPGAGRGRGETAAGGSRERCMSATNVRPPCKCCMSTTHV